MAILNAVTEQVGQSGLVPKIIYIQTNNTVAEVTAAGFLNVLPQKFNIYLSENDIALVSTKTSPSALATSVTFYNVSFSGNNWSLTSASSSGTVNAGLANQIGYYAAAGDTISGLTGANGSVLVTNNTGVPSMLANPAAANRMLQSANAAIPAWSTSSWPATTTINQVLYSSAANTVSGLATANRAVMTTSAAGVPVMTALAADGQLIVGSTAGAPAAATLTAGTGVSITNASNSITINATGGGLTWANAGAGPISAAVNRGYVSDNAGATTFNLPATFAVGDVVEIVGLGAGGWVLAPAAGDNIRYGTSNAATSLTSVNQYDSVKVVGLVANTQWTVVHSVSAGLTVV